MVTSLKNLKNEIDSRLAGGSLSSLACCQLDNAKGILANNIVHTVASCSSLPNAGLNEGRFVYVDDINEYRFSNGEQWSEDVTSTIAVISKQVWVWGNGNYGQLGNGITTTRCSPVREIYSATDWCFVSGGGKLSVAIKSTGQIWSQGFNNDGALGDGTLTGRCSPVREISSSTDWCQVSGGGFHTAAIKTSGQLWSWGQGLCGQLGNGLGLGQCSPVREFCSATDWCKVHAGDRHTLAINTSGQLWSWGTNRCGLLGDGTTVPKCSPVREICSATDWCNIGGDYRHSAAINTTGQLWIWGNSCCGALGDGTTVDKCSPVRELCSATDWCGVSIHGTRTVAIKTSGQIWSWGSNISGMLGDGTAGSAASKCSPIREICSATDWCGVSAGRYHTAAIKTTGQIWSWGNNYCGRLGDGTANPRCSPVREFCSATDWCQVSAGCSHTIAVNNICKGFLE